MPERCGKCDYNRFISGILFPNMDLKRENARLNATLELVQRVARELSREVRREFNERLKIADRGRCE